VLGLSHPSWWMSVASAWMSVTRVSVSAPSRACQCPSGGCQGPSRGCQGLREVLTGSRFDGKHVQQARGSPTQADYAVSRSIRPLVDVRTTLAKARAADGYFPCSQNLITFQPPANEPRVALLSQEGTALHHTRSPSDHFTNEKLIGCQFYYVRWVRRFLTSTATARPTGHEPARRT
jgi:hypothetical protein